MNIRISAAAILVRELRALKREINTYPDEEAIWHLPNGISNSAGTLTLHLAGNLQSFVGATLGNTGYKRDRPAEFQNRGVPRVELLAEIERTIRAVESTLADLPDERLDAAFPIAFGENRVATGDFLAHLAAHLAFHVGQIDYHRRLVTGHNDSIGPLAISELASVQPVE